MVGFVDMIRMVPMVEFLDIMKNTKEEEVLMVGHDVLMIEGTYIH
jgi:hypothetical protein